MTLKMSSGISNYEVNNNKVSDICDIYLSKQRMYTLLSLKSLIDFVNS